MLKNGALDERCRRRRKETLINCLTHRTESPYVVSYRSWFSGLLKTLNIEVAHVQRIVLDKLTSGLDFLAHQPREHFFGFDCVGQIDPQ